MRLHKAFENIPNIQHIKKAIFISVDTLYIYKTYTIKQKQI